MSQIVIDSNYFVALNNTHDSLHQRAIQISRVVENNKAVISEYLFLEITTVLSQRIGRKIACEVGRSLLNNNSIRLIPATHSLFMESWTIFTQLKQKNISFVDCSILAIMKQFRIEKLLSFDYADFAPLQKQFDFELIQKLS